MRFALLGASLTVLAAGTLAVGCGGSSGGDSKPDNNVVLSPASGTTLTAGTQHELYRQPFSVASGGKAPYAFAEAGGSLPAGLFLVMTNASGQAQASGNAADLVGFPTVAGDHTVRFRVFDSDGKLTEPSYPLTIAQTQAGGGLTVSPTTGTVLTTGRVGQTYTPITLTVGNGTPDYTWSVAYGSLPSGLTLQVDVSGTNTAEAQVRGTPTAAGTWIFAVEVHDSAGTPRGGGGVYQITVQQ